MTECIFCKIINREIPAKIVYEDKGVIAFNDIHPKAPTHFLVIPKKHISSMLEITENDVNLLGQTMLAANTIAHGLNLTGYKVQINTGASAGQEVFHLHLHILSNG